MPRITSVIKGVGAVEILANQTADAQASAAHTKLGHGPPWRSKKVHTTDMVAASIASPTAILAAKRFVETSTPPVWALPGYDTNTFSPRHP